MIPSQNWLNYAWKFNSNKNRNAINESNKTTSNYDESELDFIDTKKPVHSSILESDIIGISNTSSNGSASFVTLGNLPRDIRESSISSSILYDNDGNIVNDETRDKTYNMHNDNNTKRSNVQSMMPTFTNIKNNMNGYSSSSSSQSSLLTSFPLVDDSLLIIPIINQYPFNDKNALYYLMQNGVNKPSYCTLIAVKDLVIDDFDRQELAKKNPISRVIQKVSDKIGSSSSSSSNNDTGGNNGNINSNINTNSTGDNNIISNNSNQLSDLHKHKLMMMGDSISKRDGAWKTLDSNIQSTLKNWMSKNWMGLWIMRPDYLDLNKLVSDRKTLIDLFCIEPKNQNSFLKITDVMLLFMIPVPPPDMICGPTSELLSLGYHYTVHIAYRNHFSVLQANSFFGINWNRDILNNKICGMNHFDDLIILDIINQDIIDDFDGIIDVSDGNYDKYINYANVKYYNQSNNNNNPLVVCDKLTSWQDMLCNESFFNFGELMSLSFNLSDQPIYNGKHPPRSNPSSPRSNDVNNNNNSIDQELDDWLLQSDEEDIDNKDETKNKEPHHKLSSCGWFNKIHFICMSLRGGITYDDWRQFGLENDISKKLKLTLADALVLGWPRRAKDELSLERPIYDSSNIKKNLQINNTVSNDSNTVQPTIDISNQQKLNHQQQNINPDIKRSISKPSINALSASVSEDKNIKSSGILQRYTEPTDTITPATNNNTNTRNGGTRNRPIKKKKETPQQQQQIVLPQYQQTENYQYNNVPTLTNSLPPTPVTTNIPTQSMIPTPNIPPPQVESPIIGSYINTLQNQSKANKQYLQHSHVNNATSILNRQTAHTKNNNPISDTRLSNTQHQQISQRNSIFEISDNRNIMSAYSYNNGNINNGNNIPNNASNNKSSNGYKTNNIFNMYQ